jgi:hypothetical protein
MPAPKPALKYQLLPEPGELNPGNAAQNYLKCFMEQRRFFYSKEATADRARFQVMPLTELPLEQLRDYGGVALRQADWAARLDTVNWEYLSYARSTGAEPMAAEAGPLQTLATALQVRLRAEVAGRRFDDAIRTAKTMFALSRHLGEHSSAVANLVGLWAAHAGMNALEEMTQQPGAPNLYWALTDLPCPLVDLRKGIQSERTLTATEFRALRDDIVMSEEQLEQCVSRFTSTMSFARLQGGKTPHSPRAALQARVQDAGRVRAARSRLIDAGYAEALVQRFSELQVTLIDDKRAFELERDERMKLLGVPLWQSPLGPGDEDRFADAGLFIELLPNIQKLRRTQARLEQQIAFMRHVEALRLYAAGNDGRIPGRLSEIAVPLPMDPVSGKPFAYERGSRTAQLEGSPLEPAEDGVRYEVMVEK